MKECPHGHDQQTPPQVNGVEEKQHDEAVNAALHQASQLETRVIKKDHKCTTNANVKASAR